MKVVILEENRYLGNDKRAVYMKEGQVLDTMSWYAKDLISQGLACTEATWREIKEEEAKAQIAVSEKKEEEGKSKTVRRGRRKKVTDDNT